MTTEQSELIQARSRILELQAELELSRKETKRQSEQLSSASKMLTNVVPQEAYDAVWKEKEQAKAEVEGLRKVIIDTHKITTKEDLEFGDFEVIAFLLGMAIQGKEK